MLKKLLVPFQLVNVEHKSTGSVGIISNMDFSACKLPDKPAVDCTEKKLAALRHCTRALDIIKNPFYLCTGEIRVDNKACFMMELILKSLELQIFADIRRLTRLPYDGIVHRTSCFLFPDDRRFALVRDTDCLDVTGKKVCLFKRFLHYRRHRAPDFLCIMLNPARFREILSEFLLRYTHDV